MNDNEPKLSDIEDYDKLSGDKKKVVWLVILSGLLIGIVTYIAFITNEDRERPMEVEKSFKQIPMK